MAENQVGNDAAVPVQVAAAAAQAVAPRSDLNIPAFRAASSPEETAQLWQKCVRQFTRKVRFFHIDNVTDQLDALAIYGSEEVEELIYQNLPRQKPQP